VKAYVVPSHDGQVVGHELHRNDGEDALQAVYRLRHADRLELGVVDHRVALVTDDNGLAPAGENLLQGAESFLLQE